MARKRKGIWEKFAEFLTREGVSASSLSTYTAVVRRVYREAKITSKGLSLAALTDFIDGLDPRHQTAVRGEWRQWAAFVSSYIKDAQTASDVQTAISALIPEGVAISLEASQERAEALAPQLPAYAPQRPPEAILRALKAIHEQAPVSLPYLARLTWGRDAVAEVLKNSYPQHEFFPVSADKTVMVPKKELRVVTDYFYGDGVDPTDGSPVVCRAPQAARPIGVSPKTLGQWLKGVV